MYNLYTAIWKENAVPNDWTKGMIVKLHLKGDLGNCDTCRGLTLPSTLSSHLKQN
jgi:hypothetical protein